MKRTETEAKTDTWDLIKLESIRGHNHQSAKAGCKMEKMFASHRSDKGLIPRTYRECLELNHQKIK